jgi:hypothetical protein
LRREYAELQDEDIQKTLECSAIEDRRVELTQADEVSPRPGTSPVGG